MAKRKGATQKGAQDQKIEIPEERDTKRTQQEQELLEMHKNFRENDVLSQGYDSDDAGFDMDNLSPAPENKAPLPKDAGKEPPKPEEPPAGDALKKEDEFETLKIDGVETKVEKSKVYETGKRALQKDMAADQKLSDAIKKAKEADDLLESARLKAQESEQKLAETRNDGITLNEDDLDSISNALAYGDESERKEAVKKLLQRPGASATESLTEEEVKRIVAQQDDVKAFESALEWAKQPSDKGGFSELFDEGIRQAAFASEEGRLAKDEPDLNYRERFEKAGHAVREAFNLNPTKPAPDNDSANEERKAQLSDSPTGISPTAAPAPEPRKDERTRHAELLAAEASRRKGR
jgi:hypothetical protein